MTPEDRLEAFCLTNFRDSSIDPWTKGVYLTVSSEADQDWI